MKRTVIAFFAAAAMVLAFGGASEECRAAVNEQDLEGDYYYLRFGPGDNELDVEFESIELDRAGGWSIPHFELNGTYEIDAGGRMMTVKQNDETMITEFGAISPDGSIIALPETGFEEPGYTILVRPDKELSGQDMVGDSYNYLEFSVFESGPEVSAGIMVVGEDGESYTLTPTEHFNSEEGQVDKTFDPVEFSLENGFLEAYGGVVRGVAAPGGDFIVIAKEVPGENGVIVMSRSNSVGIGALHGWYNLTTLEVLMPEGTTRVRSGAELYIDGNGGWKLWEEDVLEGTYGISSQGSLELALTHPEEELITSFGAVSPDGHLLFFPEVGDDLSISLAVKMPSLPSISIGSGTATIHTSESMTKSLGQLRAEYEDVPDDFRPIGEVVEFTADGFDSGVLQKFYFDISGLDASIADLDLLKLKASDNSIEFFYALENQTESDNFADGTWWIEDSDDVYIPLTATLDPALNYTIYFVIEDGGDYDLSGVSGEITDPTVLGASVAGTVDEDTGSGGSSSSSGCFVTSTKR